MKATKARVFVFLTLVILTAVFSANALTANATAATTDTAASQQSGFIASSFNNILSFFGLAEAAKPAAEPAADKVESSGCDTAPEGLLACYRGDLDASDVKGVHNGEWVGVYGYATGKVGAGSFSFNGQNRVEVPSAADLNPENVTVDGWVNLASAEGTFGLIAKGDSYSLSVRGGRVVFSSRNAKGVVEVLEGPAIKTGSWTHIAATHDGSVRRIYVDGKEVISGKQKGLFAGDDASLVIGASEVGSGEFTALADEVKVFGRALSAKEIGEIAGNAPDAADAASLTMTISPNPVTENNVVVTVSVTRTNIGAGTNGELSVNFAAAGGGATSGAACTPGVDYVFGTPSVFFATNELGTKSVDMQICDDLVAEATETPTITPTVFCGVTGPCEAAPAPAALSILDNDTVSPTNVGGPVAEGTGGAGNLKAFVLTLNGTASPFTFTMTGSPAPGATTSGGTGQDFDFPGADNVNPCGAGSTLTYVPATGIGTLTFAGAPVNCTVNLRTNPDARVEPNENVLMTVNVPASPTTATSITNDDFAEVEFGTNPADDEEGDPFGQGTYTINFDRNVPANSQTEALTVTFSLAGTARGGAGCVGNGNSPADYTLAAVQSDGGTFNPATCTGTVTFPAGDDDVNVQFVATSDRIVEPNETVDGTIIAGPQTNNGNKYTIGADTDGDFTIQDDDENITVAITGAPPMQVSEAGPGALRFVVTRNFSGGEDPTVDDGLTVNFSLAGTATGGAGCVGNGGPVDYAVTFSDDDGYPSSGTFNPATCTGTVVFGPEFFFANDLSAVVVVTPIDDAAPENHESVNLQILPGDGGGFANYGVGNPNNGVFPQVAPFPASSFATGTILNDDLRVNVQIYTPNPSSVNEGSSTPAGDDGGVLVYRVTRVGEVTGETCVNFNISSGGNNATIGTDYTFNFLKAGSGTCANSVVDGSPGSHPGQIRIPGGAGAGTADDPATAPIPPFTADVTGIQANSNTFTVIPTDDDTVEGDETVTVNLLTNLLNPALYNVVAPDIVTGTILNDDGSTVSVTGGTNGPEGTGATLGTNQYFTISRAPTIPVNTDLTVNYALSGDAEAIDYNLVSATPGGGVVACTNVTNTSAVIPNGAASCTVQVNPVEDSAVEPDETVTITITAGSYIIAGGGGNTANVVINNDDNSVVSVAANAAFSNEGDTTGNAMNYTFTRTSFFNPPNADSGTPELGNLTINFSLDLINGTATCGTDYTLTSPAGTGYTCAGNTGTLTFTGTNTTVTLTFTTSPDLVREADETVIVNVATGTNTNNGNRYAVAAGAAGTASSFINNDDEDVVVTPANAGTVTEDGVTNLTYSLTRLGDVTNLGGGDSTDDLLNVTYNLTGSATNGTDYAITPVSPVAFGAGVLNQVVTADPIQDLIPENNETVILTVTAGPNAANGGTASVYNAGNTFNTTLAQQAASATSTGTIGNDDFWVSVQVSPSSVAEGSTIAPNAGTLTYTFTRIGETSDTLCANFSVSGGGSPATPPTFAGADYAAPTFGTAFACNGFNPVFPGSSTGVIGIAGGAGTPASATAPPFPAVVAGVQTNQNTFVVSPSDDDTVEGDEVVQVAVENDNFPGDNLNYSPSSPSIAIGTILNDDSTRVEVTLQGGSPANEGNVAPVASAPGALVYRFTRTNGDNTNPLNVSFRIDGGAAPSASADDIQGFSFGLVGPTNTAVIPGGQAFVDVTINPAADNTVEADENLRVTVVDDAGYNALGNPAIGVIRNDDNTVSCSISNGVDEGTGVGAGGVITVTCTRTSDGAIAAAGLNAVFTRSVGDYTSPTSPIAFIAPGVAPVNGVPSVTQSTVSFVANPDTAVEADETVTFTIASQLVGANSVIVPNSPQALTSTFFNDDSTVSVAVNPNNIFEGDPDTGAMTYTFTRTTNGAEASEAITVGFTVTGTACRVVGSCAVGDPNNAADYVLAFPVGTTGTWNAAAGNAGTITFPAIPGNGNTQTVTLTVNPTGDTVVESDETVVVTVTGGAFSTPSGNPASGLIKNDDTSYTLEFVAVGRLDGNTFTPNGLEGNPNDPGETIARFIVRRNGANSNAGTVDVSTIPGSGTAVAGAPNTVCQPGQDYTSDGKTVIFDAGNDTSQNFDVRVCRDLVFEGLPPANETFRAQLTNPTGGGVPQGTGVLGNSAVADAAIVDDDAAPTLSIACTAVPENAGSVQVCTVTQNITSSLNTTFSFATGGQNDTATANVDYTSTASTGSIPAGSTTASIIVPIIDDNIDEPNETFIVTLSAPLNATISTGVGTVTITDNEPNTTFAINNVAQIEGNPSQQDPTVASTSAFNFRITRTGDAQANEKVCFRTVNGDIENPAVNPNEATGGPGGTVPSNVGSPDYTSRPAGASSCVTFTQGGPSVITVPIIIYGDSVAEFDESFTVELLSVNDVPNPVDQNNNPRITDALGLGIIQNDDGAPSITIANQVVTEGNTPGSGGTITFTVSRQGSTANPVTATYTTSNGTSSSTPSGILGGNGQLNGAATAATGGGVCSADNGVDYLTKTGTVTIPANVDSGTFTVTYCGDLYDENNEFFTVTLSNPTQGVIGGTGTATGTINDDDAAPIISVSDISVCEPETGTAAAVFTLTRTGLSYLTSTINVNTVDGTATTGDNDYVGILNPGGQQFSFAPTVTTVTVPVTVNGDTKFETDETFTLQTVGSSADLVVAPIGGADPIGLGIIVNSGAGCTGDAAPAFALGPVVQNEGTAANNAQAPFYVRLTRTGTTQVPATLTFSTDSAGTSTASAGTCGALSTADYQAANISVTFPAGGFSPLTTGGAFGGAQGANFVDLPVQVCQDATFEPNETFNAKIAAVAFANINPTGSPAVVTIVNDDGLAFQIRNPGPEGAEGNAGNTTFTFTIDRIGDSSVASNVCYQTVAGTATEGTDYIGLTAGAANCVSFASGDMSKNVAVSVVGDTTPELDETFFLRLLSASAGTIPVSPAGDRVATINNDDGPIPVPTGFEGDIVDGNGGAAGDNLVLANDVSAIRQFVLNGTGWVTTPNQFQRADVNLPCGNGQIDAGDVTVIRSILLNSTALVAACGPTVVGGVRPEAERGESPEVVGRIIRAVSTTTTAGQTVAVSFQLDAQGDEATTSFTVNWNPAVFTYVSSAVGSGVPSGTNLGTNTSQTAAGRLGVLLDSTNTYAAGTRQILTVTFTVAANAAAGTYPVTFSGTPTAQGVANTQGALLATTYEAGNIVIGPTAAGVRVSGRVTTAGGQALRNATVILTDSEGNRRTVTTGSFGIYAFEDVEAGQTYVVGVSAKRYRFASRVVNVTDSLADVDFVGQE